MLFILFCNFLLVLGGSGPPREINSSSFGSASVAGDRGMLHGQAPAPWPPPRGFLLLLLLLRALVQWKCVTPEVAYANKPKCPQTLLAFSAKRSGDSEVD